MYERTIHPHPILPKISKTKSPKPQKIAGEDLLNMSYAEKEKRLGDLWKIFGLHTKAGQSLNKLFGFQYRKHGSMFPDLTQTGGKSYERPIIMDKRKKRGKIMDNRNSKSFNSQTQNKRNFTKEKNRNYRSEELKDSQAMLEHLEHQFAYIARSYDKRKRGRKNGKGVNPYINNFQDFRKNLKKRMKLQKMNEFELKKLEEMKDKPKKFKIDLVPRKKRKEEIFKEIEEMKEKIRNEGRGNKGVNRGEMIFELQKKNQFAEDEVNKRKYQLSESQHKKIQMALDSSIHKIAKKRNYFNIPLPENYKEKERNLKPGLPKILGELDLLFDEVVKEIEERQGYLKKVDHLEMKEVKKRVKNEILERVAELERINRMIKEERSKIRAKGGEVNRLSEDKLS